MRKALLLLFTTFFIVTVSACSTGIGNGNIVQPHPPEDQQQQSTPQPSKSDETDTPDHESNQEDLTNRYVPSVDYSPSWADRTVKTKNGYWVNTCVPENLHSRALTLTTADGIHLSALELGTGEKGIVLSHEQGYSICSFLDLGIKLAEDGFHVIIPEFRNHGASQEEPNNEKLNLDVSAAREELKRLGATSFAYAGASCGGTSNALVAAENPADTVGLVIMSSPATCGSLDGTLAVSSISASSFFVVSPGDMNGAVEKQVRKLYQASASLCKTLVINPSGYHGTDMFRDPDTGPALMTQVLEHLESSFGKRDCSNPRTDS